MKLVVVGLLVSGAVQAQNVPQKITKVLSEKITVLPVVLNDFTVKLSSADYSMPLVKILVPKLADITIFNHRNFNEGAPCISTLGTKNVGDIIALNPGTDRVAFKVTLKKEILIDETAQKCTISLREEVNAKVRGYVFTHSRRSEIGERVLADCR